jgi:dTDP-4-amino-4,6-dideoxygalactose transaminase
MAVHASTQVPFVDLSAQYQRIAPAVHQAIDQVLQRTDFILGQDVAAFEEEFAAYCGVQHAVGLDSGLSALELLLRAYDIGPGDEVITPANTFIATLLAISSVGATPVLVEIDPQTYMIDVDAVRAVLTPRTKAIMPVHLYGHMVEMGPLMALATRHALVVIEDASQAHGARYNGVRAGALGHAAAFSLYPAKNLGAYGDAGIVVTNDAAIEGRLRLLRNYGSVQKYQHEVQGYNRRLDTLHAAVLRVKLRHLDEWNTARRNHAAAYSQLLADAVICPKPSPNVEPVYHLYVIRTADRDGLQAHLKQQGIATVIHYPTPPHLQPAYQTLGYRRGDFPITEAYAQQILSLPLFPELTAAQLHYVVDNVRDFVVEQPVEQGSQVRELVYA